MGKLAQKAVNLIISDLQRQGDRIINECINERTYNHDTYNLHDSYGYGVYWRGTLVKRGTLTPQADKPHRWYGEIISGQEEIDNFLNEYQASKGFELVVVAAMPYAEVLENASSGQHKKYKVISMSFDKLKQLQEANSTLGATVHRILRGQRK